MKTIVKLLSVTALASLMFLMTANVQAQITVGADVPPKPYSVLEISTENVKGGLRLPQLTTTERNALDTKSDNVAAKGLLVYNKDENCVNYYNGSKWRNFCEGAGWFYMPSIVIDLTTSGTFERDLYLEYKKQFTDTDDSLTPANSSTPGTPLIKSETNAPNPVVKTYQREELYYYVTGYDATVFSDLSFSTTQAGVLTYKVNANNVSDTTYMNIVFVIK